MADTPPLIGRDWALFLDVDGTLLDYAPRPDLVHVPATLRPLLAALSAALDGSLAVVSGRTIADVERLLAPLRLPMAGQHGAEISRDDRELVLAQSPSALAAILAPVYGYAQSRPAIRIEDKGLSAAIHYRGAEEERDRLVEILSDAVAESGSEFEVLQGHLVFDVRQRRMNKGAAVAWFMAEAPFAGRVPVFVGDECTDEDGFAAVLARGGLAIRIGHGGETIAPFSLASPAELRAWLDRSVAALVGK